MTNPTDPRVEAAAREMCLSAVDGDERIWDEMSERDKNFYRRRCILILRAADEAAWRPIESAPKDGTIINVLLPQDISEDDRAFYCYPKSRASFGWAWERGKFRPAMGLGLTVFIQPTHWQPLPTTPENP